VSLELIPVRLWTSAALTEISRESEGHLDAHFRVLALQLLLLFLLFFGDLQRFPSQAYDVIVGEYLRQVGVVVAGVAALTSLVKSTVLTLAVKVVAVAAFVGATVLFHLLICVACWTVREYYRNYFDIEDWVWGCGEWWARMRADTWSTRRLLTSPGIPLSVATYLLAVATVHRYSPILVVVVVNLVAWVARHGPTLAKWMHSGLLKAGVSPYGVLMRKLGVYCGVVALPKQPAVKSGPPWDAGITWQRMRVMHENENSRLWFSMYWPKHTPGGWYIVVLLKRIVRLRHGLSSADDPNFFEQWITTLRAAIKYNPGQTTDFLVTQPGNHRAYRVVRVSAGFFACLPWDVLMKHTLRIGFQAVCGG
jgi:hypothetical protein